MSAEKRELLKRWTKKTSAPGFPESNAKHESSPMNDRTPRGAAQAVNEFIVRKNEGKTKHEPWLAWDDGMGQSARYRRLSGRC